MAQAFIHGDRVTRQPLLLETLSWRGAVVISWLILIITGLAGWLLYRCHRPNELNDCCERRESAGW